MTDRGPSASETRARLGFGAGLAAGMVSGVAVGSGSDSIVWGVIAGAVVGSAVAVAINRPRRRRPQNSPDPRDGTEISQDDDSAR